MANVPSQGQSRFERLIDYIRWRIAGKPFTHGHAGYDAWMEAYDSLPATGKNVGIVSIVCPVYDPVPDHLERAIRSALDQSYEPIELVLVDDGSPGDSTTSVLDRFRDHENVTVVTHDKNRGISESLNTGIAAASGDILVFLDHDDVLAPDAVEWLSSAMAVADVAYTDEDQVTPDGDRVQPFMKPAWSPLLLLGMNYVNHVTAINRATIDRLGGFNPQFSGAQDHDLMLRIAETDATVIHVPKVLYHWRQSPESVAHDVNAKPWALEAARSCVSESLERQGIVADVIDAPDVGPYRFAIRFTDDRPTPRVLLGADDLSPGELNDLVEAATEDVIMFVAGQDTPNVALVRQLSGWFGFSGVAASGPMILDSEGRVAEAGWLIDGADLLPYGAGRTVAPEPFLEVARDTTALGGRYLVVSREHFLAVGGFRGGLTLTHAGVDLTLRFTALQGLRCVADSTVRVSSSSPAAQSFPLPAAMSPDRLVSPHVGSDGVSIASVPGDIAARRYRLRSRGALPPTA